MPDLAAQVAEQGEKVRSLKAAKAAKEEIQRAVAVLLELKAKLAAQPEAAPASPPQDLAAEVTAQGEKVRSLKAAKAGKEEIQREVAKLIELKQKSAAQGGSAPAAAPGALATTADAKGLEELDVLLRDQAYIAGFEPTKLDTRAFESMFRGNRAVAEWAARMARYYPAERRTLASQAGGAQAGAPPAKQARVSKPGATDKKAGGGGDAASAPGNNFLLEKIKQDLAPGGRCAHRKTPGDIVRTRFPPEPNGYLHIGHVKSICLNFGFAKEFGGRCHLRYDDTNPTSEKQEYIDQIEADVRWMGFDWGEHKYFASEYFDKLYEWALLLIRKGLAYVDSQSPAELSKNRGDLGGPGRAPRVGTNSPFRDRSVEENVKLFQEMRDGKHKEGIHVVRAKIDMASPNMNMRDPLLYRVLHKEHPHTGNKWCIYPLYDFAHGQEDAVEGITHSFCTLEFDGHRPLYNWFLEALDVKPVDRPVQTEFNRLKIPGTVLSKRKLKLLVEREAVSGWDDPRLPTICGLKRRGVTPESLRNFIEKVGVSRTASSTDQTNLDESIRADLDLRCPRRFAVLQPIKLVITDYPADKVEEFKVPNHPKLKDMGERVVHFSRELYIERDDYRDDPPEGYYRLSPGGSALLRVCGYVVTVTDVKRGPGGEVTEVHVTHRAGTSEDLKKIQGKLHWVSASHAVPATLRLYNNPLLLPDEEEQDEEEDAGEEASGDAKKEAAAKKLLARVNPESLQTVSGFVEAALKDAREPPARAFGADLGETNSHFQFERSGYFVIDKDSGKAGLVLNRILTLRPGGLVKQEDEDASKRSRKEEQQKQLEEKERRKKIDPKEMFRGDAQYSKFDDDGVPTHDASGEPIPKPQVKKLRKEWEKQKKVFVGK